MGFRNISTFGNAGEVYGREHYSFFHKTGSPVLLSAGNWADLSMAPGTPKYNAYVGSQYEGTPLVGAGNFGVYTGPTPADGMTKHLAEWSVQTPGVTFAPATFWLCDFLYFYPLLDMDSTDVQELDNTVTQVPRYADGAGVRAILVSSVAQTAVASCVMSYQNQDGVDGRISTVYVSSANAGMLQCSVAPSGAVSGCTPFLPLAVGDTGIRKVNTVTVGTSAGGFCHLVLVRPLACIQLREQNTTAEISYLVHRHTLPKILDGACLNFLFGSAAVATSSIIRGHLKFIWS